MVSTTWPCIWLTNSSKKKEKVHRFWGATRRYKTGIAYTFTQNNVWYCEGSNSISACYIEVLCPFRETEVTFSVDYLGERKTSCVQRQFTALLLRAFDSILFIRIAAAPRLQTAENSCFRHRWCVISDWLLRDFVISSPRSLVSLSLRYFECSLL